VLVSRRAGHCGTVIAALDTRAAQDGAWPLLSSMMALGAETWTSQRDEQHIAQDACGRRCGQSFKRRTLSQNGMCASTASQQDSARASGPAWRPIFSQLPSPFSNGAFTPCKAAALLQAYAWTMLSWAELARSLSTCSPLAEAPVSERQRLPTCNPFPQVSTAKRTSFGLTL